MKIRKKRSGGLKPEIGGVGEAPIQQVHEDILGGFEGLVLAAGLDEQLLG